MVLAMTITNLSHPLTKRYAGLSGQVIKIERQITEAQRVVSTLPELRAEIAKKNDQMVHIAGLMKDIDPAWNPKTVQPITPHAYSLPFKYGDCTTLAYDILREFGRWMTIKEIVKEVLRREGIEYEVMLYVKTAANVGAGFRRRLKRGEIQCDKKWTPFRWRVAPKSVSQTK
jgi:hypothetical protein